MLKIFEWTAGIIGSSAVMIMYGIAMFADDPSFGSNFNPLQKFAFGYLGLFIYLPLIFVLIFILQFFVKSIPWHHVVGVVGLIGILLGLAFFSAPIWRPNEQAKLDHARALVQNQNLSKDFVCPNGDFLHIDPIENSPKYSGFLQAYSSTGESQVFSLTILSNGKLQSSVTKDSRFWSDALAKLKACRNNTGQSAYEVYGEPIEPPR